jgi:hypothetical protein
VAARSTAHPPVKGKSREERARILEKANGERRRAHKRRRDGAARWGEKAAHVWGGNVPGMDSHVNTRMGARALLSSRPYLSSAARFIPPAWLLLYSTSPTYSRFSHSRHDALQGRSPWNPLARPLRNYSFGRSSYRLTLRASTTDLTGSLRNMGTNFLTTLLSTSLIRLPSLSYPKHTMNTIGFFLLLMLYFQ